MTNFSTFCESMQVPSDTLERTWDMSALEYLRWICVPRIRCTFSSRGRRYVLDIDLVEKKITTFPWRASGRCRRSLPHPSAPVVPRILEDGSGKATASVAATEQIRNRSLDCEPLKQSQSSTEFRRSAKTTRNTGSGLVAASRHPNWTRRGGLLHHRRTRPLQQPRLAKKVGSMSATQFAKVALEGSSSRNS